MNINKLTYRALMAALICITAPISFYMGPIPFSLATFSVLLASSLLRPVSAVICTVIYIMLGAVGLPVFAGFVGGFQQLTAPTGGFILGYIPCAAAASIIIGKFPKSKAAYVAGATLGTLCCYAAGTAWYMHVSGSGFAQAIGICVAPFLVTDALKIAAVSASAQLIRPRLRRFL